MIQYSFYSQLLYTAKVCIICIIATVKRSLIIYNNYNNDCCYRRLLQVLTKKQ